MRGLVPLLLSILLLHLYGAGADPESNETLFEGDIILSEEQKRILNGEDAGITQHNTVKETRWRGLWKDGRVPYIITKRDPKTHENIKKVMKFFEDETCIRFVPRVSEKFYINIQDGSGCSATVGRWKYPEDGGQSLTIEDGRCSNGT